MQADVQSFFLQDDGEIPNNQELPVIVYAEVFKDHPDQIEATFNQHNWGNSWTGGIFDFHHYHSNAHEVLGVVSGEAVVLIGGERGKRLDLRCGDVVVLPAGTGHKKITASDNFQVIGAYPNGSNYNLKRRNIDVRNQALADIQNVPIPDHDPVYGESGPLLAKWRK